MDAAAALHSYWWESPKLDELSWLRPVNNDAYKSAEEQYAAVWPGFVERFATRVPPGGLAVADAYRQKIADVFDWVIENRPTRSRTPTSGSTTSSSITRDGSPVTIIDWQLSVRNVGAIDVGYFLGESLSIEDRRAHERALLERYHDGLVAGGVTGYSFDDSTTTTA